MEILGYITRFSGVLFGGLLFSMGICGMLGITIGVIAGI
jgi:hypothetical protein